MHPHVSSPPTNHSAEAMPDPAAMLEIVRFVALRPCRCQTSGPDVQYNRHVATCVVGRAQRLLGIKTAEKPIWNSITG